MTVYRTNALFRVLYLLPALLAVAFALQAVRQPDLSNGLGFTLCLLLLAVSVPRALARVVVDDSQLRLEAPFRQPRNVYFRQLIAIERSSRLGNALLLRYHPMDERGRLDIANQQFLSLPPLEQQHLLEEQLRAIVGD